ncbi:MAG TPA: hypothetical protein VH000_06360 [Rhizomicrobium sp.]|nr:hypothetical protein [Rhizomicrobium sp.]
MTRCSFSAIDGTPLARGGVARPYRIEKSSQSNRLSHDGRQAKDESRAPQSGGALSTLSQNGADDLEPLWHGPALRAAFITQVLAQGLSAQTPRNGSMISAYRQNAQVGWSLGLDERA